MENRFANDLHKQKKFQISIGNEIVHIEIISLKESIYSVEFPSQEPFFITRITDLNNQANWVSIPHGNNEMAETIGYYIDKHFEADSSES
jgi:hypothetical protein